jgi:hypothetical protein
MVVRGCGWKYLTLHLQEPNVNSYVKPFLDPFSLPKQHPQPPFVILTMVENIKYDIGAQAN